MEDYLPSSVEDSTKNSHSVGSAGSVTLTGRVKRLRASALERDWPFFIADRTDKLQVSRPIPEYEQKHAEELTEYERQPLMICCITASHIKDWTLKDKLLSQVKHCIFTGCPDIVPL